MPSGKKKSFFSGDFPGKKEINSTPNKFYHCIDEAPKIVFFRIAKTHCGYLSPLWNHRFYDWFLGSPNTIFCWFSSKIIMLISGQSEKSEFDIRSWNWFLTLNHITIFTLRISIFPTVWNNNENRFCPHLLYLLLFVSTFILKIVGGET